MIKKICNVEGCCRFDLGENSQELAKEFEVHYSTIKRIGCRLTWTHLPEKAVIRHR